jgi:ABC-type Zn uptake system ZnuABC Zn-binding protein ZnuA
VATTSIIGDVVRQVGGDALDLTVLMEAGQDPHTYEPVPEDIRRVENAQIVFSNGFDLEENLIAVLDAQQAKVRIVPVSSSLPDLIKTGQSDHSGVDPHVWQDPANVKLWADTISHELASLDPANRTLFESRAEAYKKQLDSLDAELSAQAASIPADRRKLVTNHDALAYFARRYGFKIIGTVYVGASEVAEPSTGAMAELVGTIKAEQVPAIFVETTVSDQLARVIAQEVGHGVKVLRLYTDSLGPPGSGADTYVGMMRTNMDMILQGLG